MTPHSTCPSRWGPLGDSVDRLRAALPAQADRLMAARAATDGIEWYPHEILGNVVHIDDLLTGTNRDLGRLAGQLPVADIGAADGDLSFCLEATFGWQIDLIDTAHTNLNHLRAARALRETLGSAVEVHDVDLDQQFRLPRPRYGLILLLGILYHLQNPFYILRELAERSEHCILSTRVARYAGPGRTPIADLPVAYLVDPDELNEDPTNYWVFSPAGLERVVRRAGWEILDRLAVGDTGDSDPVSVDERSFLLLRSTVSAGSSPRSGHTPA